MSYLDCQSWAAGTSSFGMSGVNAHALLAAPHRSRVSSDAQLSAWRRKRCWPAPATSPLLLRSIGTQQGATGWLHFSLHPAIPSLAYLQDHR